ncbi:MAG: RNA polymerase sigma factor [Candidatus Susulua stagnicola]|nr:RNA polymerase sigma factor [Candidatus Susulua stagnicola]
MFKSLDQLSDEEIVRMVQSGGLESFGILVKRYQEKMLRYGRKFLFNNNDIEDLVQEVFIKAYTNIQSFDASRKFSAWLYRIAHNQFINAIKKKKEPLPFFDLDVLWPYSVSKENADKETNQRELSQMLEKCLDKLSPKYRESLVLYYFEELTYKEIADVLHIPMATVGIRLKRGKKIMKSLFQKYEFNK